ncbi:chemotaxis protein CheA [Kiloniella laminariae]|uniref:Chemotaxis protein CheA n=1 Tax=Kiloniella laminariae TaxID=454162 RepID=A0ABT4LME3_9PROT|nr:chemotaxis protein CheA [Kiloniella laminariae]MCZ4282279.1 chemotaxis protein CheA [Kiloniella laminariae]
MSNNEFNLDQFKATYFEECAELLIDAETRLALLQQHPDAVDVEDLHAIFRVVHSVKGGAGAFSFDQLVGFAHIYETLLDKMRQGTIPVTEELITLLLAANDILTRLIQAAQDGVTLTDTSLQDITSQLKLFAEGGPGEQQTESARPLAQEPAEQEEKNSTAKSKYIISFSPKPHLFQHANEPLLLVREMKQLGELSTTVNTERLPNIRKIEPDIAYFSWVFELVTDRPLEDIEEVFEFVTDDCDLEIKVETLDTEPGTAKQPSPEDPDPAEQTSALPGTFENTGAPVQAAPPLTTTPGPVPPAGAAPTTAKVSSIRVDLDRVDRLVNMVGELVITQAMLKQQVENLPPEFAQYMSKGFEDLGMHTREIQESVMAVRMQPVKSVFSRIPRLVRELASKLNKQVELITLGEHTEVDKTVIEQLADPLIHMIRNSLDHGIEETANDRIAAGKPAKATVTLSAEHRSGRIHIIVIDDGRGINRERVRIKAIEKGIISSDASLSDEAIDELIFSPGFSTADEVTDVSGRGVGMDVVRRNIINLGGRIAVQSTPGQGTKFIMSLPLTLAVLDGMIVSVGQEKFIISLTSIIESLRPAKKDIHPLSNGSTVVAIRGEYLRLVLLHNLFNIPGAQHDPSKAIVVVVEIEGGRRVGVLVDELLGQQQVVIKSLEENYDPVEGISAATILGNGKVALILDVDGLDAMAKAEIKTSAPETSGQGFSEIPQGTALPLDKPATIDPRELAVMEQN